MDEAETVHFWHEDVGDDEGRVLLLDQLMGLLSVAGSDHFISFEFEGGIQQGKDIGNIFYYE